VTIVRDRASPPPRARKTANGFLFVTTTYDRIHRLRELARRYRLRYPPSSPPASPSGGGGGGSLGDGSLGAVPSAPSSADAISSP
jgi:hypothetical protein